MVSGECLNFDSTERFCRDEAELKYGDSNKNGRNQCCLLLMEIDCLRPFVDKVCSQHRFLDTVLKNRLRDKTEFRTLQCGPHHECSEESYSIWILILGIFASSIAVASFCIICVVYIRS